MRILNKNPSTLLCRIFLLLTLALVVPATAHERAAMRFDHLTVADGLAQSAVMDVVQDQQGFMWFATENGLDRFDGVRFKNYGLERGVEGSLASNFARDLELAPDGSLWVATDGGGVSRWDPVTDRFTTWRHNPADAGSLASDRIRTIGADANGNIWIGTREDGLHRLNTHTGKLTHIAHDPDNPNSLSNNEIFDIAIAPNGEVWVGTLSGLNRVDPLTQEVTRFTDELVGMEGIEDDYVRTLVFDSDGILWIGTQSAGLCSLNPETLEVSHNVADPENPASLPSNQINALYIDSAERLWVGTESGLSLRLQSHDTFQTFTHDETDSSSIGGNSIFSIFQDRGDVLWVGTRTFGVSKWNPRSWSFGHVVLEAAGEVSTPNITAFTSPAEDATWVGTFGEGILIADDFGAVKEQFRHDPENPESLGDDRVMTLLTDSSGNVWAGTMRAGLNRIDPASGRVERFVNDPEDPTSLAANGVMSLLESSTGHIWVGTFGGGVSRLDVASGRFDNFSHVPGDETSLSNPRATSVAESPDGVVFVGTDGGGLNVFSAESSTWRAISHDPANPASLSSNTVYALHFDANGRLWVASRAGIDMLVRDSRSPFGYSVTPLRASSAELPRSAVFGVQSDSQGNVWLSTSNGLVNFEPGSGLVRSFHTGHGLQGEEFNFGASYKAPDGTLYFGGIAGYNRFMPEELEFNTEPPPIALTGLSVMSEPVDWPETVDTTRTLELGYADSVVTFDVAALDFAAPEKNEYAYRLDGFDEDWNDLGNDRRITYTNLDGGDYVLRVKAANSDGAWNEASFAIPITVAHPPWNTWWAYCAYVLAAAFLAFSIWNRQQQKLKRELDYSRRLEHEVRERTNLLDRRNAELKDANTKLVEASTTDALTGLRNRRFLYENIEKDVELVLRHYRDGTETLAPGGNNDLLFLMVDLDNFKPVNDTCGHEAGDALLMQVRDVLLDACRASDDVIRWGGDEFLVIARDANRRSAATLADRIRASLSERVFRVGNGQVARITTSIGYATFPFIKDRPDLLGWEEVLGVADAAMYEAKQKRNAWMGIEGLEWDGSGADLYQAIKSTPGDLAEDGVIRAVESLEAAEEASA